MATSQETLQGGIGQQPKDQSKKEMSRRTFLKGFGAAGALTAVGLGGYLLNDLLGRNKNHATQLNPTPSPNSNPSGGEATLTPDTKPTTGITATSNETGKNTEGKFVSTQFPYAWGIPEGWKKSIQIGQNGDNAPADVFTPEVYEGKIKDFESITMTASDNTEDAPLQSYFLIEKKKFEDYISTYNVSYEIQFVPVKVGGHYDGFKLACNIPIEQQPYSNYWTETVCFLADGKKWKATQDLQTMYSPAKEQNAFTNALDSFEIRK